jgi:hypothetical protein
MAIVANPITYCNLTTDLLRAYQNIYSFLQPKEITGWTLASGQVSTYVSNATGYCSAVFQDGSPLTSKTSIALTEATASTFYYDATNDKLYVHTSAGTDPDGNNTIEIGIDRVTFLGECRAVAQGEFESMLDRRFPRPLPESEDRTSYLGRKYDEDIIMAVAKLTCAIAISSFNPQSNAADDIVARLRNEAITIISEHNENKRAFTFETTKPEIGNVSIIPYAVSGDGMFEITGVYAGANDAYLRVKIILGGAIGTATYKYSTDDGTTYNTTAITTANTWASLTSGLYIRFDDRGGTFTADDVWRMYAVSSDKSMSRPSIGSIDLVA